MNSLTKRSHARSCLTARLRDRSQYDTTRPITAQDVSDCRLHNRKSPAKGRQFGGAQSAPHSRAFSGHHKLPADQSGSDWTHFMTISQVRQILNVRNVTQNPTGFEQDVHLPDIKIKISSVPEYYPNIKVTLDKNVSLESLFAQGAQRNIVGSKDLTKADGYGSKSSASRDKREELLARTQALHLPPSDRHVIDILDRQRLPSADKTRRWILDNPLGPEENNDFTESTDIDTKKQRVTDSPTTSVLTNNTPDDSSRPAHTLGGSSKGTDQPPDGSKRAVGPRKHGESKRVRFCSDKWLLRDDSYMFD